MAYNNNTYSSPMNDRMRPPWVSRNRDTFFNQSNNPSLCANDSIIAENEQDNLYAQDFMDVDTHSASGFGSLTNSEFDQQSESDAAFALQLQSEEYSRETLPAHRATMKNRNFPSYVVDPDNQLLVEDALLAEHLQAEENRQRQQQQRRPRQQPPNRLQQFISPENIPSSNPLRHARPPFRPRVTRTDNNFPQLFRIMSNLNGEMIGGQHNFPPFTNGDFSPNDYEALLQLDESVQTQGLTNEQIDTLPTETCKKTSNNSKDEKQCSICMDTFEKDQTLRRLPCLHLFHQECIDHWIKTKNLCPVCRIKAV